MMMKAIKDQQIFPSIHIALLEETHNWSEAIQQQAGRLFGVYLFDRRRHVHACEFTPSYELHFLKTIYTAEFPETVQGERERDALEMEIMQGDRDTPLVCYVHTHVIDGLPTISLAKWSAQYYRQIRDEYDDSEELHDAVMDAMLQAESESESDYYDLISRIDAQISRNAA